MPIAHGPGRGTTILPLAGSTYGRGWPAGIGPVNGTGSRPDGAVPTWPGVVEIWWGSALGLRWPAARWTRRPWRGAASSAVLQVRPAVSRQLSAVVMPVLPLFIVVCASWLSQDVVW